MMTNDEICALVQAHKEGRPLMRCCEGVWVEIKEAMPLNELLYYIMHDHQVRPKPEPKLRPWRPEEVPVGALIRCKDWANLPSLITSVDRNGIITTGCGDWGWDSIREKGFEHSTDGGKTWKRCGVEE